ncbi:MAG: recombinase zinc beta ribbon domain-containing protein, partial [Bacillota bacterium]|nr:recombinase zinc beta ribbon domain-containing protein [Bacillota bacterium]
VDGRRNNHARKPEEEIIKLDGAIPAIVSKEDFERVQEIMNRRAHKKASCRAKEVYLLSGKIICGNCGTAYVGNRRFNARNKKYVFYSCNNMDTCKSKSIRREFIETYVFEQLTDYIFNDSLITQLCKAYNEYLFRDNKLAIARNEALKRRHKEVCKEIENIVDIVAKTGSSSLLNKLDELEKEKAITEFNIESLTNKFSIHKINEDDLRKSFDVARKLFKSGQLSTCRTLIDLYVDRVIVYDDYIELRVKIKPDLSINPRRVKRNRSGSILPTQSDLCGYCGAEGGT